MTRMPVAFADDVAAPQPRKWTPLRVLVWTLLFGALAVWIGAVLMH